MLIIRPEQMKAFRHVALAALVRRIGEHLRTLHGKTIVHFPDHTTTLEEIPDTLLNKMIRDSLDLAGEYGIDQESSLTTFVTLRFVHAPNFDEHPLIRRVLIDDSIKPNARIEALWTRTKRRNWKMIEQNYDPQDWGFEFKAKDE